MVDELGDAGGELLVHPHLHVLERLEVVAAGDGAALGRVPRVAGPVVRRGERPVDVDLVGAGQRLELGPLLVEGHVDLVLVGRLGATDDRVLVLQAQRDAAGVRPVLEAAGSGSR